MDTRVENYKNGRRVTLASVESWIKVHVAEEKASGEPGRKGITTSLGRAVEIKYGTYSKKVEKKKTPKIATKVAMLRNVHAFSEGKKWKKCGEQ